MLSALLNGLVGLIYPNKCLACKKKLPSEIKENFICSACWGQIKLNAPPFCHCCGRHLAKNNLAKNICSSCQKTMLHFDRAFSPCLYEGVIKDLIHEFKYKKKDYLAGSLSRIMIDFIEEYTLPVSFVDLVVPVPLHKIRLREREFNQAKLLSEHIAKKFNKDLFDDGLVRLRNTRTQTEMENLERFQNVKDTFALNEPGRVKHKNILLIDDVLTTGATCSEAALTLKNAGANIVFVMTLAN